MQGPVGTTGRGIGPAYVDKFARTGVRVVDLLDRSVLREKLAASLDEKNSILSAVYGAEKIDVEAMIDEYIHFDDLIDPYVTDTTQMLGAALADGKRVLAEGAQGSLLDIDFGTYPFVTSSHPTAGGSCTGLGIPPTAIDRIIGIVKAYSTRVGNGPFVTELFDETGESLRRTGHEFGATTGRPRRCGWLDLVALKYTAMVNGFTEIALTKLDVLSDLEEISICTAYRDDSDQLERFPSDLQSLESVSPTYEVVSGWMQDISDVTRFEDLPVEARDYVSLIESRLGIPVRMVSTGPKRSQTIIR